MLEPMGSTVGVRSLQPRLRLDREGVMGLSGGLDRVPPLILAIRHGQP